MKFSEAKEIIDRYFSQADPEELYNLALSCGFEEVDIEEGDMEEDDVNRRIDEVGDLPYYRKISEDHSKLLASIAVPYYSFRNGSLKKTKNSPYI